MEEFGCIMNSIFMILTFAATLVTSKKDAYFYSSKTPSGIILSKGFPYSYNSSETEIFHFSAAEDEKVQIVFEEFNLFRKSSNQRDDVLRCGTDSSYISYSKADKTDNNDKNDKNEEKFCGDKKPLPIMSAGSTFILKYNSVMVPANNAIRERNDVIGFNATFRFLKDYGVDSGKLDGVCEFYFNSSEIQNGTFNSPNFPGTYPTPIVCYYYFMNFDKNVVLNFTEINLLGSNDCIDVERGKKDYIQISTSSDASLKEATRTICGKQNDPIHIILPNQTLFVIYYHVNSNYSDYDLAEHPFIGFNASFLFTNENVSASSHNQLPDFLILCVCVYQLLKIHRIRV